MKKARAMYIPAGGKKAVWGPVDHNVLPEGYPYKEKSETNEVLFEDSEIAFTIDSEYGGAFFETDSPFGSLVEGEKYTVIWDGVEYTDIVAENVSDDEIPYIIISVTNADDETLFQIGGGVMADGDDIDTYNLYIWTLSEAATHSVSIFQRTVTETIHPMAPEFLPAGVGGNDREFIVELTQDYHGQFSGNKTYEEMLAAAQASKYLVAYMTTPDGYVWKSVGFQVANDGDATIIAFLILGVSLNMPLTIGCAPDNNWSQVTT